MGQKKHIHLVYPWYTYNNLSLVYVTNLDRNTRTVRVTIQISDGPYIASRVGRILPTSRNVEDEKALFRPEL